MSVGKQNNFKKVTVTIPVYNGKKFISNTIESILKQGDWVKTITIMDDASEERIEDVIKEYLSKIDLEYYRNERNIGYPKNWNNCFERCKTKYLIILHQDDELIPFSIEKQIQFLHKHPEIALVGGREDIIDITGKLIRKSENKETKIFPKGHIYEFVKETGSYIPCSSVMFDMEKIREVGYFDEDTIATDELYWPKVLSKYPIAILGESLIYRRAHPEQTEYADFVRYEKDSYKIYKKFHRIIDYEKRNEYKKKIQKFLQFKFSKSWLGIAVNVAKQGYRWISIKYVLRAIKINPGIVFYFPRMWKTFAKILIFFLGIKTQRFGKS